MTIHGPIRLAALLLLGALAYANVPTLGFVWDDIAVVDFQLERLQTLADVIRPPPDIVRWSYQYYRPLMTLSYLVDARVFGAGEPAGAHLSNLLVHLVATALLWRLLLRALAGAAGGAAGAWIGAALFAVHPIHTESVTWMAGRSDVFAAAGLFGALLCALAWRDRGSRGALAASALLFLAALMSKEVAVTGLGLLPLVWGAVGGSVRGGSVGAGAPPTKSMRAGLMAFALWVVVLGAFVVLRQWAGSSSQIGTTAVPGDALEAGVRASAFYLMKLVWPWPQVNLVAWEMAPGAASAALATLTALVLTGLAAVRAWRGRGGTAFLAWGWFWVTISPPLLIAMQGATNTPLAERYLYLPSVALSIGVGLLSARLLAAGWRRSVAVVTVAVLSTLAVATFQRNGVWRDDIALWSDAARGPAVGSLAWLNLGLHLMETDERRSIDALAQAAGRSDLTPLWRSRAENGIGHLLMERGDADGAEPRYRAAIAAAPDNHEPYYGLAWVAQHRAEAGDTLERDAQAERAVGYYVVALQRNAAYHAARLRFAGFLAELGDWRSAAGDQAGAERRWRAAVEQLDALDALIPAARRARVVGKLAADSGIDPAALRARLATQLTGEPAG
ncbi:MAG: hypothetical protein FJ197_05985 [Gammaproteobacteria bacterium]|nr:hypothetical protein [Gammaproteobacteria bacterium]